MKKIICLCLIGVLVLALTGCASEGIGEMPDNSQLTKNSYIEQYEGLISGTELKSLVKRIKTYNENDLVPNDIVINDLSEIGIKNESGDYDASNVRTSAKFEVTLEYDNDGWVTTVNVSEVKENTSGDTSLNISGEVSGEQ